jgi:Tol biopolymer transport system component
MTFFSELRRRNVFRVGAAYAVVGWVLIEVADVLLPTFDAPAWVMRVLVLFLAVGFVVAIVLAWIYEMTPAGIRPTRTDSSGGSQPAAATSNRFSDIVLGLVVVSVGYLMVDQLVLDRVSATAAAATNSSFESKPARLTLNLPEGMWLAVDSDQPALALSPDGRRIAFVAYNNGVRRLFIRELSQPDSVEVSGSEGALTPFFSSDGESLGFVVRNRFRFVPAGGGVPSTGNVATGNDVMRGAAWFESDRAVVALSSNSGLQMLSPVVRSAEVAVTDVSAPYLWPSVLFGFDAVLFADNTAGNFDEAVISRLDLETGETDELAVGGTSPHYSESGHVLYGHRGDLYAIAYDAENGQVTGERRRLLDSVLVRSSGAVHFSVAQDGTLAYVPGDLERAGQELVRIDRDGNVTVLLDDGGVFAFPRLSPDARLLAVTRPTGSAVDVSTVDLDRNNLLTLWTDHPGEDFGTAWAPDSRRFAFASEIGEESGDLGPLMATIDGPQRDPVALLGFEPDVLAYEQPTDWSFDGRHILFTWSDRAASDIHVYDVETRASAPWLDTSAYETAARFSPDGSLIAYISDASGALEVYVDTFPERSDAIKVSIDGGDEPVWSRDGRELFYRNGDEVYSVTIADGPAFEPAAPRLLFSGNFIRSEGDDHANFDVAADGRYFYMIREKNPLRPTEIEIVLNWPVALGLE